MATAGLGVAVVLLAAAIVDATLIGPTAASLAVGGIELATAAALAAVARGKAGAHRRIALLMVAGLAAFGTTAVIEALARASGGGIPVAGPLDAGWLAGWALIGAAVVLLHREMNPEPGWQVPLDGLIIGATAAILAWRWGIEPLAADGEGGVAGALINTLYPTVAFLLLLVVGWLAARARLRPRWVAGIALFLAVMWAGGNVDLHATLARDASAELVSYALVAVATAILALTGRSALTEADEPTRAGPRLAPLWTQAIPLAAAVVLLMLEVDGGRDPVDLAATGVVLLVVVRLVAALVAVQRLMGEREWLLMHDPLTGACNRRSLGEELGRLIARAGRDGTPLSVAAFDLDGFKGVNDRLGHHAGDEMLAAVARRCATALRAGDLLCRTGGDEFVAVLPGMAADDASDLAARLGSAVVDAAADVAPGVPVDASFGVAAWGRADDADRLLRRADAALYAAKGTGGGSVRVWEPADGAEELPARPEPRVRPRSRRPEDAAATRG